MTGHSMIVPGKALNGLHKAVDILKGRTRMKMTQPTFIEYLFETDPQIIADMVYENYFRHIKEDNKERNMQNDNIIR